MAAHGAQLQRRQDDEDAQGGDAHRRARPQGDHRRRRVPARAPAPGARRGAERLERGERVVRTRFGVDDEICTGDHSCIRLSGCPSLTVKPNPDPLRSDPVATVIESCVGCGLCGEVAHAAVLCPSFYRAEIIRNPNWWDRLLHRVRRTVIGAFAPARRRPHERSGSPADHYPHCRARWRRRWRAHRLDRRRRCGRGLPGAVDVDPRGRAAHRRHHLLRRDPAHSRTKPGQRPAGAGAHPRRGRRRRGDRERASRGRPRHRGGLRHPRSHADDRLDQPRLSGGREDGDGRRPLRQRPPDQGGRAAFARASPGRHGGARQGERCDDQRGDARAHRRQRPLADYARRIRGGDPRRRQGGRTRISEAFGPASRPRSGRMSHVPRATWINAIRPRRPRSQSSSAPSQRPCRRPPAT